MSVLELLKPVVDWVTLCGRAQMDGGTRSRKADRGRPGRGHGRRPLVKPKRGQKLDGRFSLLARGSRG
jgi:hypothetical protein